MSEHLKTRVRHIQESKHLYLLSEMKTRMATERAGEVSREKIIWDFVGPAKDSGFYPKGTLKD